MVSHEISQFLHKERHRMPGSTTTPGWAGARIWRAFPYCLPLPA